MASFDILHLSDFHIAKRAYQVNPLEYVSARLNAPAGTTPVSAKFSSHCRDAVNAMAVFAYVNQSAYDVMLVTGDAATTGDQNDLDVAKKVFDTTPNGIDHLGTDGSPTLAASQKECLVLPGNHDRYGRNGIPGNTTFDTIFGNSGSLRLPWIAGQGAQELWRMRKQGITLVIIGADFSLASTDRPFPPVSYLGRGRAYDGNSPFPNLNVLNELVQLTQVAKNQISNCIVVWAIHFDPFNASSSLELLNSNAFLTECDQQKIPLVLCGHTHDPKSVMQNQTRILTCGTTTQYYPKPYTKNSLSLVAIDWDGDPRQAPAINVDQYDYDPTTRGAFQ